jgi:hypothetical protein
MLISPATMAGMMSIPLGKDAFLNAQPVLGAKLLHVLDRAQWAVNSHANTKLFIARLRLSSALIQVLVQVPTQVHEALQYTSSPLRHNWTIFGSHKSADREHASGDYNPVFQPSSAAGGFSL